MKKETVIAELTSLAPKDVIECRMYVRYNREHSSHRWKRDNSISPEIWNGVATGGKIDEWRKAGVEDLYMEVVQNSAAKEIIVIKEFKSKTNPANTVIIQYKQLEKIQDHWYKAGVSRKNIFGFISLKHI